MDFSHSQMKEQKINKKKVDIFKTKSGKLTIYTKKAQ